MNQRFGTERDPSQIMDIKGPDEQQIDCLLEDLEEYAGSMDGESEDAAALNEAQYDMLVDGTPAEQQAFQDSVKTFFREKAEHKVTSQYGLPFSPHYLRLSRAQRDAEKGKGGGDAPDTDTGGA